MKKTVFPLVFLLIGAAIIVVALLFFFRFGNVKELEELNKISSTGEQATTMAAQQQNFNQALEGYASLEREYRPTYGNGKLYFNLGNMYFYLGEYGLAAYAYYQSKVLMPSSDTVRLNLNQTLAKLGLPPLPSESIFHQIFVFHYGLSLPVRLEIFFFTGLAFLFFFSAMIWMKSRWLKGLTIVSGVICAIFFLSACASRYIEPIEGVMVSSSSLYRDAGFQSGKVREELVRAGVEVEVLNILNEGQWLKIMAPDGTLGYVPASSIRLIHL